MRAFKVSMGLNGRIIETTVTAQSRSAAQALIHQQYPTARVHTVTEMR